MEGSRAPSRMWGHVARLVLAFGIVVGGILGGLWIASEGPNHEAGRVFVWIGAVLGVLVGGALVVSLSAATEDGTLVGVAGTSLMIIRVQRSKTTVEDRFSGPQPPREPGHLCPTEPTFLR